MPPIPSPRRPARTLARPLARTLALAALALLVLVGLVACEADPTPRLHDLYLYDRTPLRVAYFYGEPGSFPQGDGSVRVLEPLPADVPDDGPAPVVRGALAIDGEPYRATRIEPVPAPFEARRIPLSSDLQLRTRSPLPLLVYWDGRAWLNVAADVAAGLDVRVAPRPRIGRLRGLGELTRAEADALADRLERAGEPLLVAQLPDDAYPERTVPGLSEYLRTGVVVQRGLATDPTAFRPPPEEVVWEVLARGQQAPGVDEQGFELIANREELASAWTRLQAGALEPPPLPEVDFRREAVAAIYLGTRPTGGYGAEVRDLTLEDGDVYVDVAITEPAEDAVVTQSVTSPWLLLRILREGVDVVWFRDPDSGRLLGVARGAP